MNSRSSSIPWKHSIHNALIQWQVDETKTGHDHVIQHFCLSLNVRRLPIPQMPSADDRDDLKEKLGALERQVGKLVSGEGEFCSFCGKERSEVRVLFSGPEKAVRICDECVLVCRKSLDENGS